MVKTQIIAFGAAALLLCSCGATLKWEKIEADGHMTGVGAITADNQAEALGKVEGNTFYAPNGKVFEGGVVTAEARILQDAQPGIKDLKMGIAYAPEAMVKRRPESALSNMIVDQIMRGVEETTGRHVDMGLTNFGGIRCNIDAGPVLMENIVSMLPFKNYIAYFAIKGSNLIKLCTTLAENRMEAVGGVEIVCRNHKLESLKVGGEPVDPDKIYGLASIDFLMNGGDNINLASLAEEIITTDVLIRDVVLEYVTALGAEGKPLEYKTDGRVVFLK